MVVVSGGGRAHREIGGIAVRKERRRRARGGVASACSRRRGIAAAADCILKITASIRNAERA